MALHNPWVSVAVCLGVGVTRVYQQNTRVATRNFRGEAAFITPEDRRINILNHTATAIWELCGERPMSLDDICAEMEKRCPRAPLLSHSNPMGVLCRNNISMGVQGGKKESQVSDILRVLSSEDSVMRLSDSMYMGRKSYDRMIGLLRAHFSKKEGMTVAEFRDMLGTTRKYALPLLEHLDSNGVTLRVGDQRKLLKK